MSEKQETQQVTISRDALTVLVQLVQLAQKKGAYSLDESYLAFNAINSFVDEPKYKKTEELVQTLFSPKDISENSDKKTNDSQKETVIVNSSGS